MSESFTGVPAGISGYTTPNIGDVVIDSSSDYEYVCINATTGNTPIYTWEKLGGDSSWSLSTHGHGNITNGGELGTASRLVLTDTSKLINISGHYASSSKIAVNSTNEPDENLYVNGTIKFNIGTSDSVS
jgi:hypothetical protein